MTKLTGLNVVEALKKDAKYAKLPSAVREINEAFFLVVPEVLKDLLGRKVSLAILMEAKVLFLKYCMENGFLEKHVAAMGEEAQKFAPDGQLLKMLSAKMIETIDRMAKAVNNIPDYLKIKGMSEIDYMLSKNVDLTGEARKLYVSGDLTVEKLLTLQPGVILMN